MISLGVCQSNGHQTVDTARVITCKMLPVLSATYWLTLAHTLPVRVAHTNYLNDADDRGIQLGAVMTQTANISRLFSHWLALFVCVPIAISCGTTGVTFAVANANSVIKSL